LVFSHAEVIAQRAEKGEQIPEVIQC